MFIALMGCALTARTGLVLCFLVILSQLILHFLYYQSLLIKVCMIFFISFSIILLSHLTQDLIFSNFDLGIVYQFAYILPDISDHFSQEWRGDISLLNYIFGTGSAGFAPGDNGYTMFISQHGLITLAFFLVPYIYYISKQDFKLAIGLSFLIFVAQIKTDFIFSVAYAFLAITVIKHFKLSSFK